MAGVYIKDIEMPTNDEMLVIIKSNGEVKYKKSVESMWNITTSVPVPNHGDLIDAHSLKIRLGQRFSLDKRRVMEIVREIVGTAKVVIPADKE